MGVANASDAFITFTPDGTIGIVPQDDGSLGVFRFDDGGTPVVVHAGFMGGFYAGKVLMDPSGAFAWVLDQDTTGNGGGVYQVAIACDGTLTSYGRALAGDGPSAVSRLNGNPNQAIAAARTLVGASSALDTVHLLDVSGNPPYVLTSAAGFPDTDAIPPGVAVSRADHWVAVPDNGLIAGNRIAVLELDAGQLVPLQLVTTSNPMGVAFSPFSDDALVVNSDGTDAYRRLTLDAGTWAVTAPLTYAHGSPQLPGAPLLMTRGQLNGRVFIAELDSVRELQFEADGGLTDLSKTPASGTGNEQILGTLGVAP